MKRIDDDVSRCYTPEIDPLLDPVPAPADGAPGPVEAQAPRLVQDDRLVALQETAWTACPPDQPMSVLETQPLIIDLSAADDAEDACRILTQYLTNAQHTKDLTLSDFHPTLMGHFAPHIAKLPALKHLSLQFSERLHLTNASLNEFVDHIKAIDHLKSLEVDYYWYAIEPQDSSDTESTSGQKLHSLVRLMEHPSLQSIKTRHLPCDIRDVIDALEASKSNSKLQELNLHWEPTDNDDVEAGIHLDDLLECIANHPHLKKLKLDFDTSEYFSTSAKGLVIALTQNTTLQSLDCPFTFFEPAHLKGLEQALGSNTTLQQLSLDFAVAPYYSELANTDQYQLLKEFANGIAKNKTIKHLNFAFGEINNWDSEFKMLLDGISKNFSITSLKLWTYHEAISRIIQMLEDKKNLTHLRIGCDQPEDLGVLQKLAAAVQKNESLVSVEIEHDRWNKHYVRQYVADNGQQIVERNSRFFIDMYPEAKEMLRQIKVATDINLDKLLSRMLNDYSDRRSKDPIANANAGNENNQNTPALNHDAMKSVMHALLEMTELRALPTLRQVYKLEPKALYEDNR